MTLNLFAIFGVETASTIVPPVPFPPVNDLLPDVVDDPAEQLSGDWYWSQIPADDYRYLTGPRNYPSPCQWCRGRLVHNALCDELRRSWEPVMPFGKHKGRRLSNVPNDYLTWLTTASGIDAELRDAIQLRLEQVPKETKP